MHNPPKLLRASEAAEFLSVSIGSIYRYIAKGELESVQIGSSRRIPLDACEAFVDRLRSAQSAPADTRKASAVANDA